MHFEDIEQNWTSTTQLRNIHTDILGLNPKRNGRVGRVPSFPQCMIVLICESEEGAVFLAEGALCFALAKQCQDTLAELNGAR